MPPGTPIFDNGFIIGTLDGDNYRRITHHGITVEVHESGYPRAFVENNWYERMRRAIHRMGLDTAGSSSRKNSDGSSSQQNSDGSSRRQNYYGGLPGRGPPKNN